MGFFKQLLPVSGVIIKRNVSADRNESVVRKRNTTKTASEMQRSSPASITTCQKDCRYKVFRLAIFMVRLAAHAWTQPA